MRIALQAAIFGLMHSNHQLNNYHIVTQTALAGCAFGYLMEKTSNLAVPLIYHSAGNFLAYYLIMK